MTYQESIEYMYQQLPMFHRVGKLAYKADLTTAIRLDEHFHHPHQQYKTIHVAGTNGKGSVSHMLAAILQVAGYKTGLFTSPHLKDFRERIRINGEMIPEADVVTFIEESKEIFSTTRPSFFEMTSALAFYYFLKAGVDVAIIEVGMGGRLDSTNIITPQLSVITNIGFDHTEFLGNTLGEIANEKAGIIKEKVPVVIGEYHPETWPVFSKKAISLHTMATLADKGFRAEITDPNSMGKQKLTIYREDQPIYEDLPIDLLGVYQQKNICTVLAALDKLMENGFLLSKENIKDALANVQTLTGLQGRWQQLDTNPLTICDTGHNVAGLQLVLKQIQSLSFAQLHMVLGFVNDKDIQGMLDLLPKHAIYYFTNANIPRALNAEELKNKALAIGLKGESYPNVELAVRAAKMAAGIRDLVFIGGSNFIVAEAL